MCCNSVNYRHPALSAPYWCAVQQDKLVAACREAEALQASAAQKLPGAEKLRKAHQERQKKIGALLARMHEIEDRIFAAFSKKVRRRPAGIVKVVHVSLILRSTLHAECSELHCSGSLRHI